MRGASTKPRPSAKSGTFYHAIILPKSDLEPTQKRKLYAVLLLFVRTMTTPQPRCGLWRLVDKVLDCHR